MSSESSKINHIIIILKTITIVAIILLIPALFHYSIILSINGNKVVNIAWPNDYVELGATALKCNEFKCKDITDKIKISNKIDKNKIGSYKVSYSIKNAKELRIVNILDNEAPRIELLGSNNLNICNNDIYEEEGYNALDNYDGSLSDKVVISQNKNRLLYTVNDSSNNSTSTIRSIAYNDIEYPTLTLNGEETLYYQVNEEYNEPGYTALDNCDGNITNNVVISSTVNMAKAGYYHVNYSVKDSFNNITTKTRNVVVYDLNTTDLGLYQLALNRYIKDKNYNTSIIYYNINNEYTYSYNESQVYYGASLIKILDALYVYDKMTVTDYLKELVKPTIENSNNKTHMKLVKLIGAKKLKEYGKSMGRTLTLVGDDYFGNTNATDQLVTLKYLYNFITTNELGNELKEYFINDQSNYIKFEGLPTVMHKYGYTDSYFHDVGIVLDKTPYIIVILTQEGNHDFKAIINDISQKIYTLHKLAN